MSKHNVEGNDYWYSRTNKEWYRYAIHPIDSGLTIIPSERIIKELNKLKALEDL